MSRRITLLATAMIVIVAIGFVVKWRLQPAPTVTLKIGMTMTSALDALAQRGLSASPMGMTAPHQAFNLPDGETVVLIGDTRIDSIQIITGGDKPKMNRTEIIVPAITF